MSSVSSGNGGSVYPDLHHKMSKKIAQLTKVIYHLNTVNENNQFAIEATNSSHSQEIQTILKDASSKINRFREQIEEKRAEVNLQAQLEQLKEKHSEEKSAALKVRFCVTRPTILPPTCICFPVGSRQMGAAAPLRSAPPSRPPPLPDPRGHQVETFAKAGRTEGCVCRQGPQHARRGGLLQAKDFRGSGEV